MYLGNTYTATAAGSVLKLVHCEQCNHEFGYKMSRKAAGDAFSTLGLSNQRAADAAETQAGKRLQRKLAKSCDPVPCPECGLYQPEMVARLRVVRFKWLDNPVFGLILSPIFMSIFLGGYFARQEQPILWFGVLFGVAWGLALAIGLTRTWLNRVIDPNASPANKRIALGKRLSMTKAEFERLAQETDE